MTFATFAEVTTPTTKMRRIEEADKFELVGRITLIGDQARG